MQSNSKWSAQAARDWYGRLPWIVGCNYTPASAVNQLEMWQPETFDPQSIDRELGWAAAVGLNSVRVFLHDLLYRADPTGFLDRIEQFLTIADRHGIKAMIVFFDSVWHPFPRLGTQRLPEPGVHNSGWLQSPGVAMLRDDVLFGTLESYITNVVRHFKDDPRILVWDLWNEPDNSNASSYGPRDLGGAKGDLATKLLPLVFDWARAGQPTQPLTSGVWLGDWSCESTLKPYEKVQLSQSDVVSFHCYGPPDQVNAKIEQLKRYDRPILCTEYMARGVGSTFELILPIFHQHKIAAYHWGLVAGKTQTHFAWGTWQSPCEGEPPLWFHELFHPDGSPYRENETGLISQLANRAKPTT